MICFNFFERISPRGTGIIVVALFLDHVTKQIQLMKIKLLLATIIGAVSIHGAVAGTYCPPPAQCAKCPVDCCDDQPGNVGVSYMSDYIFRGVRYSRDAVGLHASYTIDNCIVPVMLGVNHITSLASRGASAIGGANPGGDQSNLYAAIGLPGVCGFDLGLRYDHFLYPNWRGPSATNSGRGDSHGQLGLTVSREIFCGVTFAYTAAHDFQSPSAQIPFSGVGFNNDNDGAWIHTLGLSKSICISDCIGLDLSGGVLYTDNVWGLANASGSTRSAGWNNYYLEASMPISVGNCATLAPYVGYNGTPDSWLGDGTPGLIDGQNANDVLHGGVRFNVKF